MRSTWRRYLPALAVVCATGAPVAQAETGLVGEAYHVSSADAGIELYVRNRRPADMEQFRAERTLLFVHGATYPAEVTFDLRLDGLSWMDHIASQGYDVWMMDLRGYGRSTRPPEMAGPAQDAEPLVTTDVAVRDFGAVVEHVLERRGIDRLNVMGWSWGTVTTAAYTAANPGKVARLVLFAPIWVREGASPLAPEGSLGAYRTVAREAARARWLAGVPEALRDGFLPGGWFEAWWQANMEADPVGAASSPPVVRAPNGVLRDSALFWARGRPYYDPASIRVPVLLTVGEWDVDTPPSMSLALFEQLSAAPAKRLVLIGEGTHSLLMEPNRMALFREVQLFLDEAAVEP
jgi:pimeloyl-ACP methyl ester carboxylesterase